MSERYQIFDQDSPVDSQPLAAFLAKDGQLLLPMVELVEQAQCAVDEVVDVMGRATIEATLQMSAQQLAGPKQQGKTADGELVYHGQRTGQVALKERQLRIQNPSPHATREELAITSRWLCAGRPPRSKPVQRATGESWATSNSGF